MECVTSSWSYWGLMVGIISDRTRFIRPPLLTRTAPDFRNWMTNAVVTLSCLAVFRNWGGWGRSVPVFRM